MSSLVPCIPVCVCCVIKRIASSVGKVSGFQTAFFHCLCCGVSVDTLGITALRASYECMLEASHLGEASERDTYGFSTEGVKDGSSFCVLCYEMTRKHSIAFVVSSMQSERTV